MTSNTSQTKQVWVRKHWRPCSQMKAWNLCVLLGPGHLNKHLFWYVVTVGHSKWQTISDGTKHATFLKWPTMPKSITCVMKPRQNKQKTKPSVGKKIHQTSWYIMVKKLSVTLACWVLRSCYSSRYTVTTQTAGTNCIIDSEVVQLVLVWLRRVAIMEKNKFQENIHGLQQWQLNWL